MHARHTAISFIGLGSHTAAPLLYSYISEHPNTCFPSAPTNFFASAKIYAQGVGWYESQFGSCPPGTLRGELSHTYLMSSQAASLIAKTYPNAKLLAVIENPLVSVRVEYVEAVAARRITRQMSLAEFLKKNPEVLLRARYGRQLVHYFSYYAPTDLLVLLASDVRDDVIMSIKKTYEHLGLDTAFVPLTLRHLVVEEEDDKKKPGPIKRAYRFAKNAIKSRYHRIMARLMPKEVKTETAAELARKIELSPELEAFLKDYFREDVAKLSSLLHRNLSVQWGFTDEAV